VARDWQDAGVAAVVIVSLGVGIGVNTAVFSWIQAMVLQPIPGVAAAASFQLVEPRADTGSYPGASWLEYLDLRDRLRALPDLVAFRMVPFNVGEAGRPERTHGLARLRKLFFSYSVSRRTTEIGVRLALGATARRVVSHIVGETLSVVGAGALAGWLVMFMVALHLLGGAISLPVFAGVPAILLLVAAVASWLPARRATAVDVKVALRQE
jgi:hypothetical protein